MVNAKIFLIAQINQAIIPSPSIRMNDTFQLYTPPDDGLKRLSSTTGGGSLAIGDDFSINPPIPSENSKDYRLPPCPPPSSAFNTTSAKITFINFNFSRKG
jgi:hypothetical protein